MGKSQCFRHGSISIKSSAVNTPSLRNIIHPDTKTKFPHSSCPSHPHQHFREILRKKERGRNMISTFSIFENCVKRQACTPRSHGTELQVENAQVLLCSLRTRQHTTRRILCSDVPVSPFINHTTLKLLGDIGDLRTVIRL